MSIFGQMFDSEQEDEREELRREALQERKYQAKLSAHPDCRDPDHPGCDDCCNDPEKGECDEN